MKEYNHENKVVIIIDSDGDSFEVYQKSLDYINENIKPNISNFKNGFWSESGGYFIKDNIIVYLEYSNWTGTVLRVDENISAIELKKVRQWALEIYKETHKNEFQ